MLTALCEHAPFDLVGYRDGRSFVRVSVKYRSTLAVRRDQVQVQQLRGPTRTAHTLGPSTRTRSTCSASTAPTRRPCYYVDPKAFGRCRDRCASRPSRNDQVAQRARRRAYRGVRAALGDPPGGDVPRGPDGLVTSAACGARSSPRNTTSSARASTRSSSGRSRPTTSSGTTPASCPATCSPRPAPPGSSAWPSPRSTAAAGSTTSATTWSSARSCSTPASAGAGLGLTLHNDICLPVLPALLPTTSSARAGCPASRRASSITAIAMTEPGIGSDLASMTHDGDPRRRPLRRQRLEDVHHQRHQRRPRDHRGEDRPDAAPRGHDRCSCSSGAWTASSAAATSTRSACTRRTPPSCSSPTCTCPSPTCSATRARASRTSSTTCRRSGCRSRCAGVAAARGRVRAGRSTT